MKRVSGICILALLLGCICTRAWATDCSKVPNDSKFMPSRITFASGISVVTNEVRRPGKMIHNNKASIAVWCPWMEPPPVERNAANILSGKHAKIFRNVGPTRDRFPYVVQSMEDTTAFYIYKNVRYNWSFEKNPAGDPYGGNMDGKSGVDPWTPFFLQSRVDEEVFPFIEAWAEDKTDPGALTEKKVFPNRHTTAYDSGIQGNTQVAESSILQQVMMTVTYERAKVQATPEGAGYPEEDEASADVPNPEDIVKGTVNLTEAPADDKFVKGTITNDIPSAYQDVWTLGKGSAYTLCYVEDYRRPEGSGLASRGNTYTGKAGGYIEGGITMEYADDNANASAKSDQMRCRFKYYLGNADIYKIENPFYGDESHPLYRDPYLYFFFLRSNYEFGPYTCGAQRRREGDWYAEGHPYWKMKTAAEITGYLNTRYANAWSSNSISNWQLGAVFATLGIDGEGKNGKFNTQQLNAAWQKGSMENCTCFQNLKAALKGRTSGAAARALTCLDALERVIVNPTIAKIRDDRSFYRFAEAGYDSDRGSYCVGPQQLEKENPQVHQEWVEKIDAATSILKGKWILAEKRLILPAHYSNCAIDQCHTDAFTSKNSVSIVLADCCGNMTTVNPSLVNTRDGIVIRDESPNSPPMPEMIIHDPRTNNEVPISIPCADDLRWGEQLVIKSKVGEINKYAANEYAGDFDLSKNDFFIEKSDGQLYPAAVIPGDDTSDNGTPKASVGIFEDQRVQFTGAGYDNIDGTTSFRGIGKERIAIYALDSNKQRIAPQQLEWTDDTGKIQTGEFIERVNNVGDPYKFDPNFRFFHIFRKPGWYQVEYKVWEFSTTAGEKKARALTYNLNVLDSKTMIRTLDGATPQRQ